MLILNGTNNNIFFISWILNHFYLADKDGSGTLTKEECRSLLIDILNAKVSDDYFDKIFKVKRNLIFHIIRVFRMPM
jgi:hypothetical protein